jgi:hypothetical protein
MTMPTLADMLAEVRRINIDHGWRPADGSPGARTFRESRTLIQTEIAEMTEEYRDHKLADATDRRSCTVEGCDLISCSRPVVHIIRPPKPKGVGSEAADVLVRLLDHCDRFGTDLVREVELTSGGAEVHHGQVTDPRTGLPTYRAPVPADVVVFGDYTDWLHEATSALRRSAPWTAAHLLFVLLTVCDRHGINLAAEYRRKVEYNRTRPALHGGRTLDGDRPTADQPTPGRLSALKCVDPNCPDYGAPMIGMKGDALDMCPREHAEPREGHAVGIERYAADTPPLVTIEVPTAAFPLYTPSVEQAARQSLTLMGLDVLPPYQAIWKNPDGVLVHLFADTAMLPSAKSHGYVLADPDIIPGVGGHLARRGSDVELWLRHNRDEFAGETDNPARMAVYIALDALLDDYRDHADTGTPLGENVEGPHPEAAEPPRTPTQFMALVGDARRHMDEFMRASIDAWRAGRFPVWVNTADPGDVLDLEAQDHMREHVRDVVHIASSIVVVNPDGYADDASQDVIGYAESVGRHVVFSHPAAGLGSGPAAVFGIDASGCPNC